MSANINIEEDFKNRDQIYKMVEEVVRELGISDKLVEILIKHPPSGSPIDMNYLSSNSKSLDLEIVDSLDNLEGRVRHELMHVSDQLDEKFNYKESLIPREGTGAFRRYKYLWNVYIDSRLTRIGKPAYETQGGREKEIGECYPELSIELRKKCFDFLWGMGLLDFEQVSAMSHDLFSAFEELKSLAQSHGEKQITFETLEELRNYGKK
ncbi:MAG: hypothetical protein SCARUB_01836 [Candidatus Scalindua rubra]|uniref:Uncharacterized protein n=1 Tax=Candidatus Scalindua rubra TaxID=1872076 RepID=A0A1E3XBI2_9BACT|nr:MAG: hypothetical protein SCARUB_01836 [Candidatus Scalindua rubra]